MSVLKSFDEVRSDLQRCGIARFYYQAVTKLLTRMFDTGVFGQKEPRIVQGEQKKTSVKKWSEFGNWHLFKQMLTDRRLIDAYLLGEEIIPKYGTAIDKNKEYVTVKYYPQSATKKIIVFTDEQGETND